MPKVFKCWHNNSVKSKELKDIYFDGYDSSRRFEMYNNPYPEGTSEYKQFQLGYERGVISKWHG